MKTSAHYVVTGALLLALFAGQSAWASEVSGTLDTSGGTPSTPVPTPTPTPPPTDDTTDTNATTTATTTPGHSSEVTGQVGGAGDTSSTPKPHEVWFTGTVTGGVSENASSGGSSGGISDEEAAHLAMMNFGPRYGVGGSSFTPGAPDAGARGSDMSALTVGGDSVNVDDGIPYDPSSYALLPRYGEQQVTPDGAELAASAITSGSGLTLPQLVLIALIGLILLGSMGYAISRTGQQAV